MAPGSLPGNITGMFQMRSVSMWTAALLSVLGGCAWAGDGDGSAGAGASDAFAYSSQDGSCMSHPYGCEIFPKVTEAEAFSAVSVLNSRSDSGSQTLILNENPLKVNGESCYGIDAGEEREGKFEVAVRFAVGMHTGNVYRYDVVAGRFEPVRMKEGRQQQDLADVTFSMISVNPDTRFITTPDGRVPFSLKFEMDSAIIEAADKHWSQRYPVPLVRADMWQMLLNRRIYIVMSTTQADGREYSQILELTPTGFKTAGFFPGTVSRGMDEKLFYTRRMSVGTTIWEARNYAYFADGEFKENSYFTDFTDTYHPGSKLKLLSNVRFRKVDLEGSTYTVTGYADEKAGSQYTMERFYPKDGAPVLENVASVYFTAQEGTVVLRSVADGTLVAAEHTIIVRRDDGAEEGEPENYFSYFDGIAFDQLFSIE